MRGIVLRGGLEVRDPLEVALAFLDAYGIDDSVDAAQADTFDEQDLRRANRGGARISAAEIAAVLERRSRIEAALRAIERTASLTDASVPWLRLTRLFAAFGDIRGVGLAKVTKALHPKRPALIPILDSVVQGYVETGEPPLAFAAHATALVRSYKHDLDRNRSGLRDLRRELARRGYDLTEVRILDLLIWSAKAPRVVRG